MSGAAPLPSELTGRPVVPPPPAPLPPNAALVCELPELWQALRTDPVRGLDPAEVAARRTLHGPNRLREATPIPAWRRFLGQFRELVVWILIAAALLSAVLGDLVDAGAILAIVILNALIGHLQEQRAAQALAALARLSAPVARVVREGVRQVVPASELVPGDVIAIEAGDHIPADARLVTAFGLQVQESSLTGESAPVPKEPGGGLPETTNLAERGTLVFQGTVVTTGQGEGVVTATGMETQLGKIAGLLEHNDVEPTPLQRRLAGLGRVLVSGCLAIVAVVFALEYRRTGELGPVLFRAISLAVAAVPEGLPAVVTLTLALGLKRMVSRNVLIRRLPSVETLGSVTVICSDKTGTLTRNEMTVTHLYAGGEWFTVTGEGYEPRGEWLPARDITATGETGAEGTGGLRAGGAALAAGRGDTGSAAVSAPGGTAESPVDAAADAPAATTRGGPPSLPRATPATASGEPAGPKPTGPKPTGPKPTGRDSPLGRESLANRPAVWATLEVAQGCQHARLLPPDGDEPGWRILGDPTEGALLVAGLKAGLDESSLSGPVVHELPFDSTRKAMSVVRRTASGELLMLTKGAPEGLLARCTHVWGPQGVTPLTEPGREQILAAAAGMASRALRVLALARRTLPEQSLSTILEEKLTFCGLAGLLDPPRREALEAVARCRSAGIRPVMITGDHPVTATAIAQVLRISEPGDQTLDGTQLDRLGDDALLAAVPHTAVYARVTPEHKLRVVKAWRARGQIVAMTGDGVNDAPAVQAADIGVAMGLTGTDVTKAASDMVLTDDNFASIVAAVEEGRGLFANIRKFIHFLLTCNTGEVLLMFLAALLGWPAPLQPIHLLWINLVTDGLPALALALEPPERDIMRQPPRPPAEPVISWSAGLSILWQGWLLAGICLVGFWWMGGPTARGADLVRAESVVFACVALCQLSLALACRSATRTTPELGWFTNPALIVAVACSALLQALVMHVPGINRVLKTGPLAGREWLVLLTLALVPVTVVEVSKLLRRLWPRSVPTGRER